MERGSDGKIWTFFYSWKYEWNNHNRIIYNSFGITQSVGIHFWGAFDRFFFFFAEIPLSKTESKMKYFQVNQLRILSYQNYIWKGMRLSGRDKPKNKIYYTISIISILENHIQKLVDIRFTQNGCTNTVPVEHRKEENRRNIVTYQMENVRNWED